MLLLSSHSFYMGVWQEMPLVNVQCQQCHDAALRDVSNTAERSYCTQHWVQQQGNASSHPYRLQPGAARWAGSTGGANRQQTQLCPDAAFYFVPHLVQIGIGLSCAPVALKIHFARETRESGWSVAHPLGTLCDSHVQLLLRYPQPN